MSEAGALVIVEVNRSRYQVVIEEDKIGGLLGFLRDVIFARIPAHAITDNSRIVAKIQELGRVVDQLKIHLENKDIWSFFMVFQRFVASDANVRNCIVKRPGEDAAAIKQLRNMVFQVWNRVLNKVMALVNGIVEENTSKDSIAGLNTLQQSLNRECGLAASIILK